jgi:hypothetical protein
MDINIEHINWTSLQHAGGAAIDTPAALLGLASTEPLARIRAMDELYASICLEGRVFQASPVVVPFLVQLAGTSEVQDRDRIVGLLLHMATASELPPDNDFSGEGGLDAGLLTSEPDHGWSGPTRESILLQLPQLLGLLDDADLAVRSAAAHLLACFHEARDQICPQILRRLGKETESGAGASLVLCLGVLAQGQDGYLDCLRQLSESDRPKIIQLAAIMALARNLRGQAPTHLLNRLIDFMTEPSEALALAYEELPWSDSHLLGDCSLVLCYFGRRKKTLVVPDLLWALERADSHSALNIAYALLYFNFGASDPVRTNQTLSGLQSTALRAIADCDLLWQRERDIRDLLRLFELPEWPDKIEDFLDSGSIEHKT